MSIRSNKAWDRLSSAMTNYIKQCRKDDRKQGTNLEATLASIHNSIDDLMQEAEERYKDENSSKL